MILDSTLMQNKKELISWMKKAVFLALSGLVLSFFINIKLVIFICLCTAINTWVVLLQAKNGLPTDVEFSTVSAVLGAMLFGITIGIFLAIFTKLFTSFIKGKFIVDHFFQVASYCIAALIAFYLHSPNVSSVGLWITLVTNIFMFMVSKYVIPVSIVDNLAYTLTNAVG
ncbi:MAG: hypothetical protein NDI94_06825, partial [Candidatus Woesearchaeota archaeon]|nr:hypothetical protein [Candidatus Woesearchaeota archaeon]